VLGEADEGRVPVGHVEKAAMRGSGSALQESGSVNESRNPNTPLQGRHLGSPKRIVESSGPRGPAVVGGEDDEGVLQEAVVLL
jgi:hypothetical protein